MTQLVESLPRRRKEIAVWQSGEAGDYIARNRRTGEAFQIGTQEYFILSQLDGQHTAQQLSADFQQAFGEPLTQDELDQFVREVETRGFLAQTIADNGAADSPLMPPLDPVIRATKQPPRRFSAVSKFAARSLARLAGGLQWLAGRMNRVAARLHFYRLTRLDFAPRPDDIFIVTYPRSGTTWMQMILYQLTSNGSMDIPHIAEYCPWFEKSLRSGRGFETRPSPRIFKSHLSYQQVPRGPCKYIYVARDGRDVALSYHHLCRSHLDDDTTFAEFFDQFVKGKVECGSWFQHVHDWWCHRHDPQVLFLRYEDLKRDLAGTVRRIAAFCGIRVSPERLSAVVDRCSFQFMKQHEEKFDPAMEFVWEEGVRLNSFIRNGRVGDGATNLTSEQRARFDALYQQTWMENELDLC